jgi:hypothetical protein
MNAVTPYPAFPMPIALAACVLLSSCFESPGPAPRALKEGEESPPSASEATEESDASRTPSTAEAQPEKTPREARRRTHGLDRIVSGLPGIEDACHYLLASSCESAENDCTCNIEAPEGKTRDAPGAAWIDLRIDTKSTKQHLVVDSPDGWGVFAFDRAAGIRVDPTTTRFARLPLEGGSPSRKSIALLTTVEGSWPSVGGPVLEPGSTPDLPKRRLARFEGELQLLCVREPARTVCSAPFVVSADIESAAAGRDNAPGAVRYTHELDSKGDLTTRLDAGSAPNVIGPQPRWLSPGPHRIYALVGSQDPKGPAAPKAEK